MPVECWLGACGTGTMIDSRDWTGLEPTWWEEEAGLTRFDDWCDRWEMWKHDRRHELKALRALWFIPIRSRPRDSRKGWTIYDGHVSNRDEEWTFWRSLLATVAILFQRRHGQRQVDRYGFQPSFDLAYWDSRSTYGGYEIMCLWLYPRCRVSIFSGGEFFL